MKATMCEKKIAQNGINSRLDIQEKIVNVDT